MKYFELTNEEKSIEKIYDKGKFTPVADKEKLKEAYTKARYSKHYRITLEELEWLGEQVEELGSIVHGVCSERLERLKKDAAKSV